MHVRLNCQIEIAGKIFTRVSSVKIESSVKTLEDTATIVIPASARLRKDREVTDVETAKIFNVGDEVLIKLGYDDNLREEFRGYVSKINPNIPTEIECMDETYLLRKRNLLKSFKEVTLKGLLNYILEGTGITYDGEMPSILFQNFYFKNTTAAAALQKLKDEYGLVIAFTGWKKLFIGLSEKNDGVIVKYFFGGDKANIPDGGTKLEFIREEDTRLKAKVIHWRKNNTKIQKEVGDSDGEQRTLYFYNLPNEGDLEKIALRELQKLKYAGYKGSLTAYLIPNCEVGNIVIFEDERFPERAGKYLVNKVTTTFGTSGARREVTLGIKL
jgi:hypothetical protein